MRFTKVVAGGTVVTPAGVINADIGIDGERIAAIGPNLDRTGAEVIDATGHHVIPVVPQKGSSRCTCTSSAPGST